MGEKIKPSVTAFISFKPGSNGKFIAFLSLEGLGSFNKDPERILREAAELYERAIGEIRLVIAGISKSRSERKPVSARTVWEVGERIYELKEKLERLCFQLDGLYVHLARDLNVKRKWLEKAVIFRRYLPRENVIPRALNWGKCEKGTRRVAEKLRDRQPVI